VAVSGTRRARLVLALGLLAVVAAVIWGWRKPAASSTPMKGRDRGSGRGEYVEGNETVVLTGDLESQRVKAAVQVTEPDGTTRFRGSAESGPVQVTLGYTADGKRDKVSIEAARGEYNPTTQSGRFEGAVKVATGLGVELAMDTLVYRGQEALAETDANVEFKRKQVAGSARGVSLAIRAGQLTLAADVKLHIDDNERGTVEITAAHGTFEKRDGSFELLGGVTVRQGESVLTAERLAGYLSLPGYVLTQLEASGNVMLLSPGGAMARQMGLSASTGSCKLHTTRLDMPIEGTGAGRELHAGPGGVDFVWWSAAGGGEKHLQANAATFALDATGRIESVHANKKVRLTMGGEPATKGRAATHGELVECSSGYVRLDPESREITQGEVLGDVVMTRGPVRAVAQQGELAESELVLDGDPEVTNAETGARLSAETIRIGMGQKLGRLSGSGNVTHTVGRTQRADEKEASLMTVTANEMEYDEKKHSGVYRGDVLLRMGSDEVSARQIQVRGAEGDLRLFASYRVVSRFAMRNKDGSAGDAAEGRAQSLSYGEAAGILNYVGGVAFQQGNLTIETPDKLSVRMTPERAMKQLVAGGTSVKLAMGDRRATGVSVTYSPTEDAFRLIGDPVAYEDGGGPGGRGLALTLHRAEDRIQLDGRDLQRTVTTIKRGQPTK
jgi:lipopolysaccharide export system protein LptA